MPSKSQLESLLYGWKMSSLQISCRVVRAGTTAVSFSGQVSVAENLRVVISDHAQNEVEINLQSQPRVTFTGDRAVAIVFSDGTQIGLAKAL